MSATAPRGVTGEQASRPVLGFSYGSQVVGIHTTSVSGVPTGWQPGMRDLTAAERTFLEARAHWQLEEGGYAHIQGTKPQTLSYGLNDSPIALAAWIVEKWRTWSDCDGDVERCFSKDELLTTVTIYWATQTINSSTRIYYENQHNPWIIQPGQGVDVPCAVARFPKENQPTAARMGRTVLQPPTVVGDATRRPLCGL